jgi:tetratricopeptide (TPR) repeat protein
MVRCREEASHASLEAQVFDVDRPTAGDLVATTRPVPEIASAIDELASRLTPSPARNGVLALPAPKPAALARAGPALLAGSASERARGLLGALESDPAAIDLRLSAVEALVAARNFEGAIRLAAEPQAADAPEILVRALRFQQGAAQLEAGRYAEASDTFDALLRIQETAGALNNRGVARFRLRDPDASSVFERAGRLADPRQFDISFNRCLALLFEDRAAEALPEIEREIEGHPRDAQAQLLKVWALRLLKREAERGEAWERLMEMAPSFSALGAPDPARRLERIFFSERRVAP